ncbi:hypothetical protein QMA02_14455 [Bacillus wiedmannii]|uniref:hypothetical protein n=1 Tax=Bacillus wiedmannii TaxID=1890302 RepID=UPI0024ADAC57|nr:hypothetical protein [Bacillus wiedmannii]MDI6677044.1 hypothetical protein [Bacillus wiedmannii]
MVAEGDRVYVEDLLFSGWGLVECIIPNEMFGIQLRLEQPDTDGHYIQRVGIEHIKNAPNEKSAASQIELQEDPIVLAESSISSLNLKEGTSYLLSASKYMQGASSQNCYVYRIEDRKFLGCHPKSCFGNWRVFDDKEVLEETKEENSIIVEVVSNVDQENLGEQLSLFDL